jgi:hypothetical protein
MAFRPNASWAGPAPDMRRPNASWVGPPPEGIASPGRLNTPHGGVGMPHGLPPQLGFGALNPSLTTGSHFTGASVPGAQSMVHPEMPQTFQAPVYSGPSMGSPAPSRAVAPIIAALMATGAAAPAASGGGYAAPPPTPRISAPGNLGLSAAFQTATAKAGPVSSLPGAFNTATSQAGPPSSLAAAFASLAQRPYAGGSNYTKAY